MEESKGNTRDELFSAAVRVFAKKGYKGATIREICLLAGAANLNSINYYFGGKEKLYGTILDRMFSAYQTSRENKAAAKQKKKKPEERLRDYIDTYCGIFFCGAEMAEDMGAIFMTEMSKPSPFLDEMVERYMKPEADEMTGIIRAILGQKAPLQVIRDCGVSIAGQMTYYVFAWPMFARLFPDHPGMQNYQRCISDHVYRFSMGGLMAVKKALAGGESGSRGKPGCI